MTREEALKELIDIRDEATAYPEAVCYVTAEDEDALNMAIEALKANTDGDLISREEVLRAIITAGEVEPDLGYTHLHKVIENLPSAEPKTGWIPVSERLPEARESVILSTKEWTGEGCCWETTKYHVIWKEYRWNATYWDDEVIAWMPLPTPYKGGENE